MLTKKGRKENNCRMTMLLYHKISLLASFSTLFDVAAIVLPQFLKISG
jgi:hypothetical protein